MSIVLISFLLLGTMLLFFISQYWQNDKNELLRRNAESISALTQKSLVEDAWIRELIISRTGSCSRVSEYLFRHIATPIFLLPTFRGKHCSALRGAIVFTPNRASRIKS